MVLELRLIKDVKNRNVELQTVEMAHSNTNEDLIPVNSNGNPGGVIVI